jgi:asparagine synthase (glutamine-hydrolysing)
MAGPDGAVVVHNGEIYNYLELRQELAASGCTFVTGTDTEVILAAYRQWGARCVERFNGMWSLALWDGKRLFLSRDRLGKKPLFLYRDPATGFLAFASEIRALFRLEGVPRRPDERTVYRYLAFSEMEALGATFFEEIHTLPPASSLVVEPGQSPSGPCPYWSLPEATADVSEADAVRTTESLLMDSVRLRLRSDAPLGLSLSGGLDSTLLLALASEAGGRELPVFSTEYRDPGYDETTYLEAATRAFACARRRVVSGPGEFVEDFERFVDHLGQPSRLPGPFSQWRVAQRASGEVKVLLDGQGADELAGGYVYFLPLAWREASWQEKIRGAPDLGLTLLGNRHLLHQYAPSLILERLRGVPARTRRIPLRADWAARFANEVPAWAQPPNGLNSTLRTALKETSLPPLLRYGDHVTMAFSIENRCPFLDHRLVSYVASLPPRLKIRGGTTKWIFREVGRGRLPERIRRRRLKLGFPTPFGAWIRGTVGGTMQGWLTIAFDNSYYARWVDRTEAQKLLDEHRSGVADHHALLWRLLCLGAWLKTSGIT